jgi:hypothetical protein
MRPRAVDDRLRWSGEVRADVDCEARPDVDARVIRERQVDALAVDVPYCAPLLDDHRVGVLLISVVAIVLPPRAECALRIPLSCLAGVDTTAVDSQWQTNGSPSRWPTDGSFQSRWRGSRACWKQRRSSGKNGG